MAIELQLAEYQLRGLLYLVRDRGQAAGMSDLREAVETATGLIAPRCEHQGVTLDVQPGEADLIVRASAEAVQTALLSLLLNALDAVSAERGHIWVRVGRDGESAWVEIADNGPGVDESLSERLFEPCVTNKPGGLGLGLTIAQQICRSSGGSIGYERVAGRTVFTVRLPLATENRADGHGDQSQSGQQNRLAVPDRTDEQQVDAGRIREGTE